MPILKIYFTSIKGRRESNEDRHNIILNINNEKPELNNINLFGIYDGHGGDWVSSYLKKHIPNYYMLKDFEYPFSDEYHCRVFELIQSELLRCKEGYSNGSTCLLNIIYKIQNDIYMNVVNLGDSRMVTVNTNGDSKAITTDHKPDHPIERSRIQKMGGQVYKDSESVFRIGDLSLSRAFGDGDNSPYISQRPDIYTLKINADIKYIVMACDGLWDVIESEDLGKIINKITQTKKTENIAVELANWALNNGSMDNISVCVIEFTINYK